jgi:hypothetical protein
MALPMIFELSSEEEVQDETSVFTTTSSPVKHLPVIGLDGHNRTAFGRRLVSNTAF